MNDASDIGDSEVRSLDLRRFIRSTSAVEVLCMLLVALVLIWSKAPAEQIKPLTHVSRTSWSTSARAQSTRR